MNCEPCNISLKISDLTSPFILKESGTSLGSDHHHVEEGTYPLVIQRLRKWF